jgi:hypothetical protein
LCGKDDGKWFDTEQGAEGDKGIHAGLTFGELASPAESRIRWDIISPASTARQTTAGFWRPAASAIRRAAVVIRARLPQARARPTVK